MALIFHCHRKHTNTGAHVQRTCKQKQSIEAKAQTDRIKVQRTFEQAHLPRLYQYTYKLMHAHSDDTAPLPPFLSL